MIRRSQVHSKEQKTERDPLLSAITRTAAVLAFGLQIFLDSPYLLLQATAASSWSERASLPVSPKKIGVGKAHTHTQAHTLTSKMLPSARRAELSRQYFDNSYLSRRAFELDPTGVSGVPYPGVGIEPSQHLHHQHDPLPKPHQQHPHQHRSRAPFGRDGGSVRSRTTAGLTTFDEDLDIDDYGGGGRRRPSDHHHRNGEDSPDSHHFRSAAEADEAESDFSDQDSLGSVRSGDSYPSSKSYGAGIRYANSAAGQIWNILDRMDDVVLEVKVREVSVADALVLPPCHLLVSASPSHDGGSFVRATS